MRNVHIRDVMTPIEDYATIRDDQTLFDVFVLLDRDASEGRPVHRDLIVVDHIGMMVPEGKVQSETQKMNEVSGDLLKLSKSSPLGNPTLLFVSPFTKREPTDLPGMHRFRDTFMLAHNARLLLGIYEDGVNNKLLHIAGMRSSNGQGNISRDIPIVVREEDGVIIEALAETHQL